MIIQANSNTHSFNAVTINHYFKDKKTLAL